MRTFTSLTILALTIVLSAYGQTTTAPVVSIPVPKLPAMIGGYVQYNQLGTPNQWTGGIVAIYPVWQSPGIYGSTLTDIMPVKANDPTTGKQFYALTTSVRQGFHKDLLDTWKLSLFVGGDVGPTFSANTSSVATGGSGSITVNLSSSVQGTLVYKATPWMDIAPSVRLLYVSNIGWNPVAVMGVLFNLKALPKAQ